jgi:chromosome segregation ATPase
MVIKELIEEKEEEKERLNGIVKGNEEEKERLNGIIAKLVEEKEKEKEEKEAMHNRMTNIEAMIKKMSRK